jgi:hypothetical protein
MTVRLTVGLILTALWLGAAALHIDHSWTSLAHLEFAKIVPLLVKYNAEVAFFWLVFGFLWLASGYFQQRADLRHNAALARRAIEQAELMAHSVESEARKFEAYQKSRIRAAQPHWEIQGFIAHREQHDINLRNIGAAASRIRVTYDPSLSLAVVLSNPILVDRGQPLIIKVLCREPRVDRFELGLEYSDALGELRRACIAVSELTVTIEHDEPSGAAAVVPELVEQAATSASAA